MNMSKQTQAKPKDWEIQQKRQGTTLVDADIAWQREYYVVASQISDDLTKYNIRHYQSINDLLRTLDKKGIAYRWWGCRNKQYAYDVKDIFQKRTNFGLTDRERAKQFTNKV